MKLWTMGILAAALLVVFFDSQRTKAGDVPDGQRWWSHVAVLADDKLEGRNTGSEGHRKAAEYVAEEFARPGSSRPEPTATSSPCT